MTSGTSTGEVALYGHWTCPFVHRVAWALAERCIDHDTIEVPPQGRERIDDRRLGDRVEVLALVEDQLHMGEGFQAAAEPALRPANTLGDRSQLPPVRADQNHHLVCLTKRIRPEDDPRVVVERHEPQGTAAFPGSWGATARPEQLDTRLVSLRTPAGRGRYRFAASPSPLSPEGRERPGRRRGSRVPCEPRFQRS